MLVSCITIALLFIAFILNNNETVILIRNIMLYFYIAFVGLSLVLAVRGVFLSKKKDGKKTKKG